MNRINVKIKLMRDGALIPEYATEGSAAVDLRNASGEDVTVAPGEGCVIPSGIAISPETSDVVAIVAARSGLSTKFGITLANGIGVIDSDYRGEISVSLINRSDKAYTITAGERIAQLMFVPVMHAAFIKADVLDETERGTGGFGSTGKS